MNENAPDPQKKKEQKTFIFTRTIQIDESTPQGPKESKENKENKLNSEKEEIKDNIILTFNIILFDDEIVINVEQRKENSKIKNIIYEKNFLPEYFKDYKTLSLANLEKKFELIQKSFELNYDHITLEENEIIIKLMINIMDILTEEIKFEIPMIKMTNQDEVLFLKESMQFLEQERTNQKKEINALNASLQELKNIIETNKIEFQKQIKEKETAHENLMQELKSIIEANKIEFQNKLEANKISFDEKNELCNNKIKEILENREKRENEILSSVSKHQEEIEGLQITQKYVKDKIICEKKENAKEKEKHLYKRKLNNFNMEIHMILYEEKIKFNIKEIEDNLANNPAIYEIDFNFEVLSKKSIYFKNLGNVSDIFKFLHDLFDDEKDVLKKEDNKIIIKIKFPLGNKDEEISFDILAKDISLEITLKNINYSLKEINKNNINSNSDLKETKAQFKKELLEKVYPIGSYYWSSSNKSPSEIFGGSWTQIRGRFIFSSDDSHGVGDTGGEEMHTLTEGEIPRHSHKYTKFFYNTEVGFNNWEWTIESKLCACPGIHSTSERFLGENSTSKVGGDESHNNMPPFLVANCWRRTG